MTVYVLTARVLSPGGQVTAVRRQPFLVLEAGQTEADGITELEQALADAEQEIAELEAARHDEHHHHHHWWIR